MISNHVQNSFGDQELALQVFNRVLEHFGYLPVLDIILFGSRIYGTFSDDSDYDLLVVLEDSSGLVNNQKIGDMDITFVLLEELKQNVREHSLPRLELLWSPIQSLFQNKLCLIQYFSLDFLLLKKAVITISNKCMHYAKILFTKNKESQKGKKNIFHALRYIKFGEQIVWYGKIIDYKVANHYFVMLVNDNNTEWPHYQEIYGKEVKKAYMEFKNALGVKS